MHALSLFYLKQLWDYLKRVSFYNIFKIRIHFFNKKMLTASMTGIFQCAENVVLVSKMIDLSYMCELQPHL